MKKIYFTTLFWGAISVLMYAQTATLSGTFFSPADEFLTEVEVTLINDDTGETLSSTTTNNEGFYQFPDIPTEVTYRIEASRDNDAINGVSTFDMVVIRSHILGIQFMSDPFAIIAADVNMSNTITTLDMVLMRNLILANTNEFPNVPSWRFFRSMVTLDNPDNPFAGISDNDFTVTLTEDVINFDFIGVKTGDVNGSARP